MLATVGAADLTLARTLEPHTDALAILDEAGRAELGGEDVWGVYAAEGPGARLRAIERDGRWRLDGRKPWCSLADRVDRSW